MSDQRRLSSRPCVAKQRQIISNASAGQTETQPRKTARKVTTRERKSPIAQGTTPSELSNKRSRFDSSTSNQKKRKAFLDEEDDEEDIDEILQSKITKNPTEIDRCAICLDDCTEPKQLNKCSHIFCKGCIDYYFQTVKPQCPCCFTIYGEIRGNQPISGTMSTETSKHRLPGFEHDSRGTLRITYHFPNGIQDESHPNPGTPYYGTTRHAYLPDNREGRHVLELLEKAFRLRQIFTVGQSRTTGYDNVITWNDIHHKTSVHGGVENFGYPDKTYLKRVKQELAAKGIV